MPDDLTNRVTALEMGLKQSNLQRNHQIAQIHARLQNLATKQDIKGVADSVAEVVTLTKNLKIGVHVGGRVLGFSGRTVMLMGGFFIAWAALTGGIKSFLILITHIQL